MEKDLICMCGREIEPEENFGDSDEPICGICWDDMHNQPDEEFSDADPGL